jgi:glycine/D-amino acid oxidase-like deaminating enzyme
MTSVPELVVLGGGIAGLTSALAAARRGLRVTLIDQPRAGAASRASAGLLAPSVEGLPPSLLDAALSARDLYPRYLEELRDRTDVDVALDRGGVLELAASEAELERLAARAPAGSERLDARALATREPAFAIHAGAMLHPNDGAVDIVALMRALDVAVAQESRITRLTDEVASFDARGNLPGFRARGGSRYAGRRLLLASGAWAASLPGLPRALPLRPIRGQLMRLEGRPIRQPAFAGGGYLIPRGPSLVVGATSEDAGFESTTTPRGLRELRAVATRAIPVLAHATVAEHWAGLRPVSADGAPLLGADPELPALIYACGFSRNGILFGPWVAEQLAPVLASGAAPASLQPFRVDRPMPSA